MDRSVPYSVDFQEQFMSRVDTNREDIDCWIWKGALDQGYGTLKHNGTRKMAHRVAYELFMGEIHDDRWITHTCDRRRCVLPDHLIQVTRSERMKMAYEDGNLDHLDEVRKEGWFKEGGDHPGTSRSMNDRLARCVCRAIAKRKGEWGALRDIAERYEVSLNVVKDISRGQTYQDIYEDEKQKLRAQNGQ